MDRRCDGDQTAESYESSYHGDRGFDNDPQDVPVVDIAPVRNVAKEESRKSQEGSLPEVGHGSDITSSVNRTPEQPSIPGLTQSQLRWLAGARIFPNNGDEITRAALHAAREAAWKAYWETTIREIEKKAEL